MIVYHCVKCHDSFAAGGFWVCGCGDSSFEDGAARGCGIVIQVSDTRLQTLFRSTEGREAFSVCADVQMPQGAVSLAPYELFSFEVARISSGHSLLDLEVLPLHVLRESGHRRSACTRQQMAYK